MRRGLRVTLINERRQQTLEQHLASESEIPPASSLHDHRNNTAAYDSNFSRIYPAIEAAQARTHIKRKCKPTGILNFSQANRRKR